ncbi:MAG: S1C family serine protease [Patescibacteria group bacterium]
MKKTVGGGTGFFISKDGYILTNKHVVADTNAQYSVILSDGTELIGKVLALDPTTDLAIIRAYKDTVTPYSDAKFVTLIEKSEDIEVGSFVVAIGNALAQFQNTLTFGVVSGLGRQIEAGDQNSRSSELLSGLIQTDTAINPGNSGGPLVNLAGQVIGINTAVTAGANGIGFAIPLSAKIVDSLKRSVEKYGVIKRPFVGVRYTLLTPDLTKALKLNMDHGALLNTSGTDQAVIPNSPAAKAGLESGDIILEAEGNLLSVSYGLKEALSQKLPGETITLKVWKKKTEKTEVVKLTLGEL